VAEVRIITKRRLREFWERHPQAKHSLLAWFRIVKKNTFRSLNEVQECFPSADYVNGLTIFNISGNKYRLVVIISYQHKMMLIQDILTHADYDKERYT
jgi:mRNA interferase HigB